MRVVLTRLSDERHRLDVVRDDGSREGVELETRSMLVHDLVHFAVERAAGLKRGFWGSLAAGTPMAELNDREKSMQTMTGPVRTELQLAEAIVGPMQSAVQGRFDRTLMLEGFRERLKPVPPWLDEAFVDRVQRDFAALRGRWKATPFRAQLTLDWPLSGA